MKIIFGVILVWILVGFCLAVSPKIADKVFPQPQTIYVYRQEIAGLKFESIQEDDVIYKNLSSAPVPQGCLGKKMVGISITGAVFLIGGVDERLDRAYVGIYKKEE